MSSISVNLLDDGHIKQMLMVPVNAEVSILSFNFNCFEGFIMVDDTYDTLKISLPPLTLKVITRSVK